MHRADEEVPGIGLDELDGHAGTDWSALQVGERELDLRPVGEGDGGRALLAGGEGEQGASLEGVGALAVVVDEMHVRPDDERRAAMVSNLLVVLCSDRHTQPVVNTGSLYT